jgi:uncharacterized protein involved in exopolysaccharide biosynthesis
MTGVPKIEETSPAEAENLDLFDYHLIKSYLFFVLNAVRRHKVLAFLVFAFVVGTSLGLLAGWPRTYHVQTRILAQRNQTIAAMASGRSWGWEDTSLQAALETLTSQRNLIALVKQTDLVNRWTESRAPLLRLKDRVRTAVRGPVAPEDQLAALVGYIDIALKTSVGDGAVTIAIDWPDAESAVRIVDAALTSFLEARHISEIAQISEAISIIEAHAARLREQIDRSVEVIREARKSEKPAKRPVRVVRKEPAKTAFDPELAQLRIVLDGKRRAIKDLEEFHSRRLSELQARLAEQRMIFSDVHPAVVEIQQRIDALKQQEPAQLGALRQQEHDLEQELKRRGGGESEEANSRKPVLGVLPAELLRLEREAADADSDTPEVENARGELQFAMRKYGALLERIDSASMELDTSRAAFKYRYSVIVPPEKPAGPIKPNVRKAALASLIGGLMMAILVVTATDIRAGKILERWQIERQLGLDVLAEVRMS